MTDTMTEFVCRGKRHTGTHHAWAQGCRHPEAIAAHEEWKRRNRPYEMREPAIDEHGNCVAPKHGTRPAYVLGCRCRAAIRAHEQYLMRKENNRRARKGREYAKQFEAEWRRAQRATGGRLAADPRRAWRGGKMAVGRNSLFWVLRGLMTEEATMAEIMVAMIKLENRQVPDSPWRPRTIQNMELCAFLGVDDRMTYRMRELRQRLRDQRTQRRLADVQWKAAFAAEAPARKARAAEAAERGRERRRLAVDRARRASTPGVQTRARAEEIARKLDGERVPH